MRLYYLLVIDKVSIYTFRHLDKYDKFIIMFKTLSVKKTNLSSFITDI